MADEEKPVRRRYPRPGPYLSFWFRRTIRDTRASLWTSGLFAGTLFGILVASLVWYTSDYAGWPWAYRRVMHPPVNLVGSVGVFIAAFVFVAFVLFFIHAVMAPHRIAVDQQSVHDARIQEEKDWHEQTREELESAQQGHRAAQEEIDRLRAAPVSERHFQELQAIVGAALSAIGANRKGVSGKDKTALLGHFPELSEALDEWDAAIQHVWDISTAQEARLVAETAQRGISAPSFSMDKLIPLILVVTRERANTGQLHLGMSFGWEQFQNPETQGPDPVLWLKGNTSAMVYLEAFGAEPIGRSEAIVRVERLFAAAQTWPETLAYANRDVISGWGPMKAPLLDRLDDLNRRDHYKRGNGCPRCG